MWWAGGGGGERGGRGGDSLGSAWAAAHRPRLAHGALRGQRWRRVSAWPWAEGERADTTWQRPHWVSPCPPQIQAGALTACPGPRCPGPLPRHVPAAVTAAASPADPGSATGTPGRASRAFRSQGPSGGAARRLSWGLGGGQGGSSFKQREWRPRPRDGGRAGPEEAGAGGPGDPVPEQAQGEPQGQEQSLAPLGVHPVGTLGPHPPPVKGHQQVASGSGSARPAATNQGCWHPGRGAARKCRSDQVLPAGRPTRKCAAWGPPATAPHLPTCPPATESWLWGGAGGSASFLHPSVPRECPECS